MRTALNTLSLESWSADDVIRAAVSNGFSGVELRGDSVDFSYGDYPRAKRQEVCKKLDAAGLAVTNIGSSICLLGEPDERQSIRGPLAQAVSLAADYRAKGVRVFLGNFADRIDQPTQAIHYEELLQSLDYACEIAAEDGIEIWVETHNEFSTGRILKLLMDQLGRKNCRVLWDIIHSLERNERISETLGYIGPVLAHVHLNDGVPFDDPLYKRWKYTMIGQGSISYPEVIQALEQYGYGGFVSLEWERRWKPELMGAGCEPETAIRRFSEAVRRALAEGTGLHE